MYKAIEKINAEMQKSPNNKYLEIIGHYIIDRCKESPVVEAVKDEKKTLGGALEAVEKIAQKNQINGCGVVTDNEVFNAVDEYFGITKNNQVRISSKNSVDGTGEEKSESKLDINLDSFFI